MTQVGGNVIRYGKLSSPLFQTVTVNYTDQSFVEDVDYMLQRFIHRYDVLSVPIIQLSTEFYRQLLLRFYEVLLYDLIQNRYLNNTHTVMTRINNQYFMETITEHIGAQLRRSYSGIHSELYGIVGHNVNDLFGFSDFLCQQLLELYAKLFNRRRVEFNQNLLNTLYELNTFGYVPPVKPFQITVVVNGFGEVNVLW